MKWRRYTGEPVEEYFRNEMAKDLVAMPEKRAIQCGESLVVKIKDADGSLEIYDCVVRRAASIPAPKEKR